MVHTIIIIIIISILGTDFRHILIFTILKFKKLK